jgi:hypothetical protein
MEKAVVDELSDAGKGLYEQNFTRGSSNLRNFYLK